MKFKAFIISLFLFILFSLTAVRIISLNYSSATPVSGSNSYKTIEISKIRGTVFDCNMDAFTNSEKIYTAAAKPTSQALLELKSILDSNSFSVVAEQLKKGNPVTVDIPCKIKDSESIRIIERYSNRSEDLLAQHIIGYTDQSGSGVSGVEKAFDSLLESSAKIIKVSFETDAYGNIMLGSEPEIFNNGYKQENGVVLTIDKRIQRIAENAADELSIDKGAVVILDAETSAVKASLSRPLYDPDRLSESIDSNESPFINRAFCEFSVGSAFKPIVAASAIENSIEDFETVCTGSVDVSGVIFNCHNENGHGKINLKNAVTYSCNTYFIELAMNLDKKELLSTASAFGFGIETHFAPGFSAFSGNLPDIKQLDSDAAVANLSFGQGYLLATPLQLAAAMACIANEGIYTKPYLIEGTVSKETGFTSYNNENFSHRAVSKKTAAAVCDCLENVITSGTGKRAKSQNISAAGKTATAQTGKFSENGEIYNSWFVGYFPAENPQYSIAILKEDGGEGAVSCAPVFKEICERMNEEMLVDNSIF